MIQESVREMTAAERSSFERALRAAPARPPSNGWPVAAGLAIAAALALVVAAGIGGLIPGGLAAALAGVGMLALYDTIVAPRVGDRRMRKRREGFAAESERALARVLADGRVVVKRVRAVAVVEMEPVEDEGPGYLFDLGDGRVLFLKGQDYDVAEDEDVSWPNTDFEIVRTVAEGRMLDLHCHGQALAPIRIIRGREVDPRVPWHQREEVLDLTLDQAVKSVLLAR
jgi:hypothetical protein